MEPIHANSAPKADVQMSVSESLKKGIPLLMATVLHLLTFKLKPVNVKHAEGQRLALLNLSLRI